MILGDIMRIETGLTLRRSFSKSLHLKDAFAILPLNPKHFMTMFYAGPPGVRGKDLSADEVHFWNFEMMKYATNEVYSKYPYNMASDWMHQRGQWAPPKKGKR